MAKSNWNVGLSRLSRRILGAAIAYGFLFCGGTSLAAPGKLVSDDLIAQQKSLTKVYHLKNRMPVILRQVPGSDVVHVNIVFTRGYRDQPSKIKGIGRWTMGTMARAAEGYPRDELYALTARYGFSLGCGDGIEQSTCALGTVSDYWKLGLPLLAAVVTKPTLAEEDLTLVRDRVLADLRNTPSDPSSYVNELVNQMFYPKGHPYFTPYRDEMKTIESLGAADARAYHKTLLNADRMAVVMVSSIPDAQVLPELEKLLGSIPSHVEKRPTVAVPKYSPQRTVQQEMRDVPNGYVHIKFNIPGVKDKDATATQVMLAILSERLFEELRTKRSLSYSAYAYPRLFEVGIGIMGSSTSNITSTMEGMAAIVHDLQNKELTPEELSEFKMGYATEYFLTQESHVALAGAIASTWADFGNTDELYETPARIDRVTPADVKRLAKSCLRDLRAGVIAKKGKLDEKWFKAFLRKEFGAR